MGSLIETIDMAGFTFFGSIQNRFLTDVSRLFAFDGAIFYIIAILLLAALCFFRKTRKIGIAVVCAVAIGILLCNGILKPLVQRPRPYIALQENVQYMKWYAGAGRIVDSTFSFPSGHTTAAGSAMTAAFLVLIHSEKKWAIAIAGIFPLIAVLSGFFRGCLMIHYLTDILAGLVIGILAGICGYLISRKINIYLHRL